MLLVALLLLLLVACFGAYSVSPLFLIIAALLLIAIYVGPVRRG